MTSEQIERHVEKRTDKIDALYMEGIISTEEQYKAALARLNTWAEFQFDHVTAQS